jgi:hypothetical protein
MKGIYLTEEGKALIEAKISELKSEIFDETYEEGIVNNAENKGKINVLKKILDSATILPVEESFYKVQYKLNKHCGRTGCSKDNAILREYLNGVIIQPKQ